MCECICAAFLGCAVRGEPRSSNRSVKGSRTTHPGGRLALRRAMSKVGHAPMSACGEGEASLAAGIRILLRALAMVRWLRKLAWRKPATLAASYRRFRPRLGRVNARGSADLDRRSTGDGAGMELGGGGARVWVERAFRSTHDARLANYLRAYLRHHRELGVSVTWSDQATPGLAAVALARRGEA